MRRNPNDRRRLNLKSRSPSSQSIRSKRSKLRAKYRSEFGPNWASDPRAKMQYNAEADSMGVSPQQMLTYVTGAGFSAGDRKQMRNANRKRKRKQAAAMAKMPGYPAGYASRVLGSKGKRFQAGGKKTRYSNRYPNRSKYAGGGKRKLPFGGMNYVVGNVKNQRQYNAARVKFRSSSDKFKNRKWQTPIGPGVSTWKTGGPYKASGALLAGKRPYIGMEPSFGFTGAEMRAAKSNPKRRRKSGKRKANPTAKKAMALYHSGKAPTLKAAWKMARSNGSRKTRRNMRTRRNGLAFVRGNPGIVSQIKARSMAAVPVVVYGAAAGAVHAGLSASGFTATIADNFAKIPVVGPPVADNAPFTLQGVVVGVLGGTLVGAVVGARGGNIVNAVLPIFGSAVAVGAGFDAFSAVLDRFDAQANAQVEAEIAAEIDAPLAAAEQEAAAAGLAGIAFDGGALNGIAFEGGALNGLAFEGGALNGLAFEGGALNGIDNLGDGMAYEVAPLTAGTPSVGSSDYNQASLADAHYCGADMSPAEGNALTNGRNGFIHTYGTAPFRMGRDVVGASHLAGREGHRWGWLIKMVGWERTCAIAKMPASQRVATIRQLRQAAVKAFDKIKAQSEAAIAQQTAEAQKAESDYAAMAGQGESDLFGDSALFMSA